jgi:hypothetical protein
VGFKLWANGPGYLTPSGLEAFLLVMLDLYLSHCASMQFVVYF